MSQCIKCGHSTYVHISDKSVEYFYEPGGGPVCKSCHGWNIRDEDWVKKNKRTRILSLTKKGSFDEEGKK